MSLYIVDASVAAKWFTEEKHSEEALSLLSDENTLHVPDFFMLEMDSVISKWIRRGILGEDDGQSVRATLKQLPIRQHAVAPLRDSAFELANRTGRSFYDCLYLALALPLGGLMATADRKLFDALKTGPFRKHVVWVEDIRSQPQSL